MATGSVKWCSSDKAFGCIVQDGGPDVFVHGSAVEDAGYHNLEGNDRVPFDVTNGPKGLVATDVRRVG